jgi:hypothetical protein
VSNGEVYNIGVVGPTAVGKTTLITAILTDCQRQLYGRGIKMTAIGAATARQIAENGRALNESLAAGRFDPGSLHGTTEPFTFQLMLDPGVQGCEIRLALLDYPGAWLDPAVLERAGPGAEAEWAKCQRFIDQSTILLVPVDAAVLMEATLASQKGAVPSILDTFQVQQVAMSWAQERNRRPEEPALLLFCPLKCESYFADNGGHRDQSHELQTRIRAMYRDVIDTVRGEAGDGVQIYCCPIDTIGCVSLIGAEWIPVTSGPAKYLFKAHYRVRNPRVRSVKGVDDLFGLVCGHLAEADRRTQEILRDEKKHDELVARKAAQWKDGFFQNVWFVVSGERDQRIAAQNRIFKEVGEAVERVERLKSVVRELAARPPSPRRFRL